MDTEDAHPNADNRSNQRQTGCDKGTEGHQQHDRRDSHTDQLGGAVHFTGAAKRVAAVLYGEVGVVVTPEDVLYLVERFGRNIHDRLIGERHAHGAGSLVGAQRRERGQVRVNLLLRHALGGFRFAHLLRHAAGSEDRVDDRFGFAEVAGRLELVEHVVDLGHHVGVLQCFAFRSLDDDGAGRHAHRVVVDAKAFVHLLLRDGGIHVGHGKCRAWGFCKIHGAEAQGAQEDEPNG